MANATDPQNDRELLLKLNGEIQKLAESINNFGDVLKELEEKRIGGLEARVVTIENWKQQISGGWKLAVALWVILAAAAGWLIKILTSK